MLNLSKNWILAGKPALLATTLLAASTLSAQSTVLYFDDFDGDAAQPLWGTSPAVNFNAAVWGNSRGISPFSAAGSILPGAEGGGAWLPISLESNAVYQLTVSEFEFKGARMQLGFSDANANATFYHTSMQSSAWLFADSQRVNLFLGPGTENQVELLEQDPAFRSPFNGGADFRISIDTFQLPWTVDFSVKSSSANEWNLMGSGELPADADIQFVGISSLKDETLLNRIGSFELRKLGKKVEIPEPGTFAWLVGLASLGYVCMRRRKRSAACNTEDLIDS